MNALDNDKNTPLHYAAQHCKIPNIIRILLQYGADISKINKEKKKAIDLAKQNTSEAAK